MENSEDPSGGQEPAAALEPEPLASPGRPVFSSPTSFSGEPVVPGGLGLALRAVAGGSVAGLGMVAAVLWLFRTLQATGAAPQAPGPGDPIANLVLFGWLGGAGLSALVAWTLMAPITSAYRRGGLAMVAAFGTLALSLVTAPVDSLLGRSGLLGLTLLTLVLFVVIIRRQGSRPDA
jgi:hypothetical protein